MHRPTGRLSRRSAVACAALMAALVAAAPAGASGGGYRQINLVSDQPGHARVLDRHLVNAWGLANGPGTPFWVANNGTSTSTLYSGAIHGAPAAIVPLVVHIAGGGAPTGQVFNPTDGFTVNVSGTPTASRFIFDSETGKITAWAPGTTRAVVAASSAGAIFKGLTMASVPGRGALLYAADFHNNRIDVFNSSFAHTTTAWHFTDPHLPAGYAPFNVQNIGGWLYVSYAKQDADAEDEIDGPGLGAVDVYTSSGRLVRRLATGGVLNAPWGLVRAPSTFGRFAGDILVGNFGDGRIHAFDTSGHLQGTLRWSSGAAITIDGLWGLRFGDSAFGGPGSLVFSAGPGGEAHGLLGLIRTDG